MTVNNVINAVPVPTNVVLGYYDGDKPISLETFQEIFLELRALKKENKRLMKKLKEYEPDEDELID